MHFRCKFTRQFESVTKEQIQAYLDAEQATFKKTGHIPFSPIMRKHSIAYLAAINTARRRASAAYERVYSKLQKRDSDLAQSIAEEKDKNLAPLEVGRWQYNGNGIIYTLYSDATAKSSKFPDRPYCSWSMDSTRKLQIVNRMPGSPPSGWIDTGFIEPDGQIFSACNQRGAKFVGRRLDPVN